MPSSYHPRTPELRERCEKELTRRQDLEREKALEKYGEDGLLPMGNPELDTLDYQINELVGIIRYSEMNVARLQILRATCPEASKACTEGAVSLRALREEIEAHALGLIGVRLRLQDKGLHLGRPEKR